MLERFDLLISRLCLRDSAAALAARLRSDAKLVACSASDWWPSPPLSVGTPHLGAARAADAAAFAELGAGDLPMSAKRLFCLCNTSPRYLELHDGYTRAVTYSVDAIGGLALLLAATLSCFCCVLKDKSAYYDPDLL